MPQLNSIPLTKPKGRGPFAVELLSPTPSDNILNVGCFDGSLEYFFLKDQVKTFHGVDLNAVAIKKAQAWSEKLFPGDQRFQISKAENLPFPKNSFDKVLCLDTFEHVEDEQKAADEIFRVLKPGGQLVLSVPHDFLNFLDPDELTRGARNLIRTYLKKKPRLDHPKHRHYSLEQLMAFFHPFELVKVHRCGTPLFLAFALAYTGLGLPEKITTPLSQLTEPLENWDYKTPLPTGFNIMVVLKKSKKQNG